METTMAKMKFGLIGMALGSIAFMLALVHFWAGPFAPQQTFEVSIAEKAVSIRDATVDALKGKEAPEKSYFNDWDADQTADLTTAVLGGLAVILGLVSFVFREPIRLAAAGAILGAGAITFQFVAMALGIIVAAIIIGIILSQLDFSL